MSLDSRFLHVGTVTDVDAAVGNFLRCHVSGLTGSGAQIVLQHICQPYYINYNRWRL